MFRVVVNDSIELDINDTIDDLYSRFGTNYADDIANGIETLIDNLQDNALMKKPYDVINTYRRTHYNAYQVSYRDFYLIYRVYGNLVEIIDFSYGLK